MKIYPHLCTQELPFPCWDLTSSCSPFGPWFSRCRSGGYQCGICALKPVDGGRSGSAGDTNFIMASTVLTNPFKDFSFFSLRNHSLSLSHICWTSNRSRNSSFSSRNSGEVLSITLLLLMWVDLLALLAVGLDGCYLVIAFVVDSQAQHYQFQSCEKLWTNSLTECILASVCNVLLAIVFHWLHSPWSVHSKLPLHHHTLIILFYIATVFCCHVVALCSFLIQIVWQLSVFCSLTWSWGHSSCSGGHELFSVSDPDRASPISTPRSSHCPGMMTVSIGLTCCLITPWHWSWPWCMHLGWGIMWSPLAFPCF